MFSGSKEKPEWRFGNSTIWDVGPIGQGFRLITETILVRVQGVPPFTQKPKDISDILGCEIDARN